jgi:hypothetical protein
MPEIIAQPTQPVAARTARPGSSAAGPGKPISRHIAGCLRAGNAVRHAAAKSHPAVGSSCHIVTCRTAPAYIFLSG